MFDPSVAAHELMHALHHMNGMSLKGRTVAKDDPFYQPHEDDKNLSTEELATTSEGRPHKTAGLFKAGTDRRKAAQLYQINESQLRRKLGMITLFSYMKKHDQSQMRSDGVTEARLKADEISYTFVNSYALLSREMKII